MHTILKVISVFKFIETEKITMVARDWKEWVCRVIVY